MRSLVLCLLIVTVHFATGSTAQADKVDTCIAAVGGDLSEAASQKAIDVCNDALPSARNGADRGIIHAGLGCRYFLLGDKDRAVREWTIAKQEDRRIPADLLGTRQSGCKL